jgi:tRNA-splicing ligase RtcB
MKVWGDKDTGLVKEWTEGVPVDDGAKVQIGKVAALPFVVRWVAAMPDIHQGMGATIGSVIPTSGALIPAAVGVDIGCGMQAIRTSLTSQTLPDNLYELRVAIEKAVPHGRTDNGGNRDRGAWGDIPLYVKEMWDGLADDYAAIVKRTSEAKHRRPVHQLGTLGTGNHFIEICIDEEDRVWVMLHSGSRGPGARIANTFIRQAKALMKQFYITLEDNDLAYLPEGTEQFNNYVKALMWAQRYAKINRHIMMENVLKALGASYFPSSRIDCHHNFARKERHFGRNIWITRKGATSAYEGELGIIPGSMGAKSYIVKGKGNRDSFKSCSHGAGRVMSRREARETITVEDLEEDTAMVECRKDAEMLDEAPTAYKDIDAVMAAQADLVEVVHRLRQVVCVKG